MNYWLIKSEPEEYSWEDLVKDGKCGWTGIRNYRARNNLKLMKVGDLALFYHSNTGKEIIGIAKVTKEYFQDPTTKEEAWVTVEFEPVKKMNKPVSLQLAKETSALKDMELVKLSRLSVSSVTNQQFQIILELSETTL